MAMRWKEGRARVVVERGKKRSEDFAEAENREQRTASSSSSSLHPFNSEFIRSFD